MVKIQKSSVNETSPQNRNRNDSFLSLPETSKVKKSLINIKNKVLNNERLTLRDGWELLTASEPDDINYITALADLKRYLVVGNNVFYSSTFYLYPTNVCDFNCSFCAYYVKKKDDPKAWSYSPEELIEQLKPRLPFITEVHIVSGCRPEYDFEYYKTLFSLIKQTAPELHIKGLTAVEYDYLSRLHGISIETVLLELKKAGLDSLPGGGAEILVDEVRQKISPDRISSERYLEIHRIAHQIGLRSNVTLLFGHVESPRDILIHLDRIRDTQDQTGGFKTFIPIKFADLNNALGKLLKRRNHVNSLPIPLLFATSRLFLDNIFHIKTLWNYLGIDTALKLLSCGADDFSSTHIGEKVFRMASSGEVLKMNSEGMEALIKKQGKVPCQTNSQTV